ncbi:MAG TPA: hypothetical protein VMB82_06130 [Acidimicrobiales bacterium]|nr:hypothetical protein [Acidimicrobiales bacterium]
MTAVVVCALGAGAGVVGVVAGMRRRTPSLSRVLDALERGPLDSGTVGPVAADGTRGWRLDRLAGGWLAGVARGRRLESRQLSTSLAICDQSLDALCARCVLCALAGVMAPLVLGGVAAAEGLGLPGAVPVGGALVGGGLGALAPVWAVLADARRRRRDAVRVVASFLDLVVLGMAGGMGIEGALFAAASLGDTVLGRRLHATLATSRDSGVPPWETLAGLGRELGIDELEELAGAAALAGTEGAKVRSTLAARAASLRRRGVAEAEAEANAVTERLFLPGTILLVGFLLFLGYPAVSRIMSGL